MGIKTLFCYLIGNRKAIEAIGSSRRVLWIGFLFVISAGFAREYDGEDLLAEPWHLLIPLGASLASSLLLFTILSLKVYRGETARPPFWSGYLSFLGLFWMTAPLAWLYAIPYERILSAPGSVNANLLTLAVVASWRVLLMIRVATVVFGYRLHHAAFLVLLFGDALLFAALRLMPTPVFSLMGGIRLTESERIIQSTTFLVGFVGLCTLPIWLLGAIVVMLRANPTWQLPAVVPEDRSPQWDLRLLALGSVLVWSAALPFTQPEQQLRKRVETQMRSGQIRAGLASMSAHSQRDFPPHWDPPPRVGYGEKSPDLLDVLETLEREPCADWVRDAYFEKLRNYLGEPPYGYGGFSGDNERIERLLLYLARHPRGPELAAPWKECLQAIFDKSETSPAVRQAIQQLVPTIESKPKDRPK